MSSVLERNHLGNLGLSRFIGVSCFLWPFRYPGIFIKVGILTMRKFDPDEPLISIHIPKTGGEALNDILQGWFGQNYYRHYRNPSTGELPTRYNLSHASCIHGHFNKDEGHGVDMYYPHCKQFITFMREPYEIALSYHFFVKSLIRRGL